MLGAACPPKTGGAEAVCVGIQMRLLSWFSLPRARRRFVIVLIITAIVAVGGAATGVHCWALKCYDAAHQSIQDDSLQEASSDIEVCLRVWPYSASTYLLAARIARMTGDYPLAESRMAEYFRLQGEASLDAHLEMLLIRAETGKVDDLEAELTDAAARDGSHAREILESLGRAQLNLMRYRAAVDYFRMCLDRYPDDVCAMDWCGVALERAQSMQKAEKAFRQAMESSHGRSDARLPLAELDLENNDPGEAETLLQVLRQRRPDDPRVQLAWGRSQLMLGRLNEARQSLDSVVRTRPDDAVALIWRGQIALTDGRPVEAEGYVRRALRSDHSDPEAYFLLYRCLQLQPGRETEAQAALAEQARIKADRQRLADLLVASPADAEQSVDVQTEIGELCLRLGRGEMGAFWLNAALKRNPACKRAHQALAQYYEDKGDAEAAARQRALAD
jgi:tetratricopeptide (TPR) repeat protein